ncbi:MAG TPA: hypothetical protein VF797_14945 [Noviherbaspirillum sp.]
MVVFIGMLWLGDKPSAREIVLTRFMAKGQATWTGQIHNASLARDRITVVMYDQQVLSQAGSAWSTRYQDHEDWLLRLTSEAGHVQVQNEFRVPLVLAALHRRGRRQDQAEGGSDRGKDHEEEVIREMIKAAPDRDPATQALPACMAAVTAPP